MRPFITALIATAIAVLGATSASAFSLTLSHDFPQIHPPSIGQKINFQIHLDATDPGIQLLSVSLSFDSYTYQYNPQPNSAVGVPSYILYGMSGTMPPMAPTALYAQQSTWLLWPGSVPPGTTQINVNWADATFNGTYVTGLGIKIAEIQLEVIDPGAGTSEVHMSVSAGGNIFQVNGNPATPITLIGTPFIPIPEPSTALLVCAGLAGLALKARGR